MNKTTLPFNVNDPAYQQLRQRYSERLDRFVVWVGSGPSVDAGLPSWADLRQRLHDAAQRKIASLALDDQDNSLRALSAIHSLPNHWQAFNRIEEILGATTFRAEIRAALTVSENMPTPAVYHSLWRLHLDGILTTNLDRLVARAFAESRQTIANEINGFQHS